MSNEWDDPPGVAVDGSVAHSERTADDDTAAPDRHLRGPFAGLRRLIWWVFWLGLVAAIAVGFLPGNAPLPIALGYVVTIGIVLLAAEGALWLVDTALVFLKR